MTINTKIEELCLTICCKGDAPYICELFRYKFVFTGSLPRDEYLLVKSCIVACGGTMQSSGNYWGFRLPPSSYNLAISKLRQIHPQLHTLPEHLRHVSHFFKVLRKELGPFCSMALPSGDNWQYLDTQSRRWSYANIFESGGRKIVNVRRGAVLRCDDHGKLKYYKVNANGTKMHALVTRRAADNLAALYFSEITAYWVDHGDQWIISTRSLRALPEDYFYSLFRLNPLGRTIIGLLIFSKDDFVIVKEFLKALQINLVQCSSLVQLNNDASKAGGTPIIPLSELGEKKISSIRRLFSNLGATTTSSSDTVVVTTASDSFTIMFVESDSAEYKDDIFYLPLEIMDDAPGFIKTANSFLIRLGKSFMSAEKVVALSWQPTTLADDHFIIDIFLRYLDDSDFIGQLLQDPAKKTAVAKWYNDNTQDIDLAMLDILRKASRYRSNFSGP